MILLLYKHIWRVGLSVQYELKPIVFVKQELSFLMTFVYVAVLPVHSAFTTEPVSKSFLMWLAACPQGMAFSPDLWEPVWQKPWLIVPSGRGRSAYPFSRYKLSLLVHNMLAKHMLPWQGLYPVECTAIFTCWSKYLQKREQIITMYFAAVTISTIVTLISCSLIFCLPFSNMKPLAALWVSGTLK